AGVPLVLCDDEPKENNIIAARDVDVAGAQALIKSPGIDMRADLVMRAKEAGVPVYGEIDLWWRARRHDGARVIGVTGTNGKSTVTALIAHVLRCAGYDAVEGGNLGTPALALSRVKAGGFYVLELSSYHCEMLQGLALDVGIFTNLTPDHLARHGDMAGYLAAKRRMFEVGGRREAGDERPAMKAVAGEAGLVEGAIIADSHSVEGRDVGGLLGPHNAQNIACAWEAVKAWMTEEGFWRGVQTFRPLSHRMEHVADVVRNGVSISFVNDSKATNGDSAVWALRSFKNIIWICGGQAKSDGLGAAVKALDNVKVALTLGACGEDFGRDLKALGIETAYCETLEGAFDWLRGRDLTDMAGDAGELAVLLSPAAASWDQFANFEARGDRFKDLVVDFVANAA
ncbi:MAG: UDP-N-acetylmuramoyl-L-alanine--D-glutamate ligase, partial [Alphaproteobacteria bacterium CG_4_10_14_0_8_um_filter_53_9]